MWKILGPSLVVLDIDRPSLAPTGLLDSLWRVDTQARGYHVYGLTLIPHGEGRGVTKLGRDQGCKSGYVKSLRRSRAILSSELLG